jgi:hypothetical protein
MEPEKQPKSAPPGIRPDVHKRFLVILARVDAGQAQVAGSEIRYRSLSPLPAVSIRGAGGTLGRWTVTLPGAE